MRLANSSQFAPAWARNLLFFGVAATSLSVLFAFLFPTNTIRQPLALQEMGESVLADIATTAGRVDDAFELEREQNGLNAAPLADELTIARRLSLGLAGTLPSLQEIRAFESQPVGMRLSWWVSRLLEDETNCGLCCRTLGPISRLRGRGAFCYFPPAEICELVEQELCNQYTL